MTLLIDYSAARPSPATIKASGYSGVMRYLSTDPGKNLQPAERDALLAAGLSIGLVWETTAARSADGFAAGAADAKAAEAEAAALGLPAGLPIFYAVDFAAAPSVVKPYFDGARSVATRPVGIYGSLTVVDAALAGGWATYAWQSCAWSGGKVSQRAHLYQRLSATVVHPIADTDENIVLRPFPLWTKAAPAVTPAPKPVVKPAPRPTPRPPASSIPGVFHKIISKVVAIVRGPAPVLRVGSTGPSVRALQAGLNHVFPAYSKLTVDGDYGKATDAVVREFQRREWPHVPAMWDGVVGPTTRAALARCGITF